MPTSGADIASAAARAPRLSLTDFLDIGTLQEIQDSFTAVTRQAATILDAEGNPVTAPTDTLRRAASDEMLEQLIAADTDEPGKFIAPIVIEGQQLGSIAIEQSVLPGATGEYQQQLRDLAKKFELNDEQTQQLIDAADQCMGPNRAAGVQFLHLLANSLARLCYQTYQARMRIEELAVLYKVSTALSGTRDVQRVMDFAVESIADVMKVKGVCIRLLTDDGTESLIPRAVYGLSKEYLDKGTISLSESPLFREAFEKGLCYVRDMTRDPRVLFPEDARSEGMTSMLCAPLRYQGERVGTLQIFSHQQRQFTRYEQDLLKALAQLLATAIESTRLEAQRMENERLSRQLQLAADVQRRMIPSQMPDIKPFDIAARYVPSFELSGDFFDFIHLEGHLGIVVGDVVGKGVAASLLMASVRASIRAFAEDVYDLHEIIERVNAALTADTRDNEFVTLWYGVFDPQTRRLTYCNAGHDPPLLLRGDQIIPLDIGGMIMGIDGTQLYETSLIDLQPGDAILLYTDGLTEAMNFEGEQFGRERIKKALRESADGCANDIVNHVLWNKRRFCGLHRSSDDLTLVVVKVGEPCPDGPPSPTETVIAQEPASSNAKL